MSKIRLNDRTVAALKPRSSVYFEWDALLPGLGVRVSPRGAKSYVVYTRWPRTGKPARRSLGKCGVLLVDDARERARKWLLQVADGVDPAVEAKRLEDAARLAAQRAKDTGVKTVWESWIAHVKRQGQRKAAAVERDTRREFADRWKDRSVHEITKADVLKVIDEAVERGSPCSQAPRRPALGRPQGHPRVLCRHASRPPCRSRHPAGPSAARRPACA